MGNIPDWVNVVATFFGGGVGLGLWGVWSDRRRHKEEARREAAEAQRKRDERATRLHVFALEAVELEERWVQYLGQRLSKSISFSQPFEFTSTEHVNEAAKLGAGTPVLSAIYRMKALNADVANQVRWAQELYFKLAIREDLDANQKEHLLKIPLDTFGRASAFIMDVWDAASAAVKTLVDAAEADGAGVEELRGRHVQTETKYKHFTSSHPDH